MTTTPQTPKEFLAAFWPNMETIDAAAIVAYRPVGRGYGWLETIQGKLAAEGATGVDDAELERHLGPCVCGPLLVQLARFLRDEGYSLLVGAEEVLGGR